MKEIKITLIMLLFCQAVIAQSTESKKRVEKKMAKLEEKVSLEEMQKQQISEIMLASAAKAEEHRSKSKDANEELKSIRKEERAQIKEVLSTEQVNKLQEATKLERAQKQNNPNYAKKKQKKLDKEALKAKRAEFDKLLSSDEIAAIEKAKSLKPAKVENKSTLTVEQKAERKAVRHEIKSLLDPIIANHKTELDSIKQEMVNKQSQAKSGKKSKEVTFYKRFLLMK